MHTAPTGSGRGEASPVNVMAGLVIDRVPRFTREKHPDTGAPPLTGGIRRGFARILMDFGKETILQAMI